MKCLVCGLLSRFLDIKSHSGYDDGGIRFGLLVTDDIPYV